MKWEEIVKIQYDAMLRSSVIYVTILSAIIAFAKQLSLSCYSKTSLVVAFLLVLLQSFAVLYLTNVQRQASWEDGVNAELNNKENVIRKAVLWLSFLTTLSIIITIALILFS